MRFVEPWIRLRQSMCGQGWLIQSSIPKPSRACRFGRPATVVSDTSGVLQGGLDFIVRHIPKARVKVPAIVQMEIRNFSHRFFKIRRESKSDKQKQRAAKQLVEHLNSQGAERALLRLELQDDVEIERTIFAWRPAPQRIRTRSRWYLSGLAVERSIGCLCGSPHIGGSASSSGAVGTGAPCPPTH